MPFTFTHHTEITTDKQKQYRCR